MQRCLNLASNGLGLVAPNPMVGAVIVHNDRIIGEGFHTGFGKPHAEVEAFNQVADPSVLPDSTLYVSLEPCNHQGKTPPCTRLILEKGVGRVIVAQADPNTQATGGISLLRSHGVDVITGVLEKESRHLNRRFNTFHEKERPWLILKWAETSDGYVDTLRDTPDNQRPTWITDEVCRRLVHKWRSEEPAILAGSQTILADNPQLNIRNWTGNNPLRLTIDRFGRLLPGRGNDGSPLHLIDGTIPTVIFTYSSRNNEPNLEFVTISSEEPVWPQVLTDLYQRNIQSVLIEGGPTLFNSLINQDLWDEARVFIGSTSFGKGISAPYFPFEANETGTIGNSQILMFYHRRGDLRSPNAVAHLTQQ